MKFFLKIYISLFFLEVLLSILGQLIIIYNFNFLSVRWIVSSINILISLPISLIDRRYPFYAQISVYQGFLLFLVNLLIHVIIVYLIFKIIKNRGIVLKH